MSSVVIAPRTTLGCECDTPAPETPESALCGDCGLIHLTSEEYAAHLAERRAEVDRLIGCLPQAEAPADDEPRPRWRRRRRRR